MRTPIAAFVTLFLAAHAAAAGAPGYAANACSAGLSSERHAGLDGDLDAVPDSEDWCPYSKEGARVGPNGCADWEMPVDCAAPGASAGGLIQIAPAGDSAAEAASGPAAAAPPAVAATDGDGDGVADDADRCAATPKGLAVDANGCVQIEKVVLKGVNFATGSAKLLPAASGTLKTVAAAMKANPKIEVEIGGHTDSVGVETRNQRLSERRAKSVKAFLVGEGVEDARLSTVGYGEAEPVDSNETPAGRANNRRVAFRVTAP
jgi:OOP family OmpA-OmpF porin